MTFLKQRSLILLSIACILINLYILHAWNNIPGDLWPSSPVQRNPTREEYLGWLLITQISPWVFFFTSWTGIILGIYSAKRNASRLNAYFFLAIIVALSNLGLWVVGQAIILFKYLIH